MLHGLPNLLPDAFLTARAARVRSETSSAAGNDGLAVDFVVESDRAQLSEIVRRVRDGRLRTHIGNVSTLDDAVAAFNPTKRIKGKTIIRVRP
jgi:NADPH:quinone reductase-like Zn-dependent oxidoreductase